MDDGGEYVDSSGGLMKLISSDLHNTPRRRMAASFAGLAAVLALIAGCACSAAPAPIHTDPSVAVIRHVLVKDNTFGVNRNPFSRVMISPKRTDGTQLSSATKAAINSQLRDLGDVKVSTRKASGNEASIQLGRVVTTSSGVNINVSMYCGNVCGLDATYTLVKWPGGGWTVTGTTGPVGMA